MNVKLGTHWRAKEHTNKPWTVGGIYRVQSLGYKEVGFRAVANVTKPEGYWVIDSDTFAEHFEPAPKKF